jgi:sodium-dependent phosphate transporter
MIGVAQADDLTWVVVVGGIAMAYMAWGIGANDVANAFGPAFGARALSVKQACVIAAICEAAGAILMGGSVADTIRKGMMSVKLYDGNDGRVLIMTGMTSILIGAATWLLVASKLGLPVSTTHSAVGGVIALAIATKGYESVSWDKVGLIIASWFISPVMSAVMAAIMYLLVHHLILKHDNAVQRAKLSAPLVVFTITFVIALFTIYKGGKGLGLHKTSTGVAFGASVGIGFVCGCAAYPFVVWWASRLEKQEAKHDSQTPQHMEDADLPVPSDQTTAATADSLNKVDVVELEGLEAGTGEDKKVASDEIEEGKKSASETEKHSPVEQMFRGYVVIVAGFFSLAHGANDVANSVGPFGAVLAAYEGPLEKKSEIPMYVFVLAGVMIVIGLATYGVHVMRTIGNNIAAMTPSKAFCVNFAATAVVLIATRLGIPISTTHASVGAVVGVGLASGCVERAPMVKAVNWKMMGKVFFSWVVTLPIVGISAMGVFAFLLPTVVNQPI